MKSLTLAISIALLTVQVNSLVCQVQFPHLDYGCLPYQPNGQGATEGEPLEKFTPVDWTISKTVRVVFHFFQDDNGSNNFDEVPQGFKNYTAYELANEIVNTINGTTNPQANIPSGNTIPIRQKNIDFIVDHVFLYEDSQNHPYGSSATTSHNTYGFDTGNTIQIFMKEGPTGGSSGNASNVSLTDPTTKWVEINTRFDRYIAATSQSQVDQWFGVLFHNVGHELLHTLGLSHTVRWNWGAPCDETDPAACNDFCADTPTPFEMFTVHSSNTHPACGWSQGSSPGCSNNWMDYSNMRSLTPDQIDRVHFGLENALSIFKVCEELQVDNTFCDLGYPLVHGFGESITIGGCVGSLPPYLEQRSVNTIIFSDEVVIKTIEVESGAEFEIIYKDASCQ